MKKISMRGASWDSMFLAFVKILTTLSSIILTKILSAGLSLEAYGTYAQANTVIAIGTSPYLKDEAPANFRMFERIFTASQDIRRSGSAAIDLASIATGRIDGFLEKYLHIWDYAAGTLLIREAGGAVLEYDGGDFTMKMVGSIIAGTKPVAKILADEYAIR